MSGTGRPTVSFLDSYGNVIVEKPAVYSKVGAGGDIPRNAVFVGVTSATDDSLSRLQELEALNARLVVERDAAERALERLASDVQFVEPDPDGALASSFEKELRARRAFARVAVRSENGLIVGCHPKRGGDATVALHD